MLEMYIHGTKYLVVKNKATGRVENIRSNHNYNEHEKKLEIEKIKKDWSTGDYKLISVAIN